MSAESKREEVLRKLREEIKKANEEKAEFKKALRVSPLDINQECETLKVEKLIHSLFSLDPEFLSTFASCEDGCLLQPIDVLNTIFSNIDVGTRYILAQKLNQLGIAIPFMINGEFWTMTPFKIDVSEKKQTVPLVKKCLPKILFGRIGHLKRTKSELVNEFMKQRVFYTRDFKGGNVKKWTQDGTIDLAWLHKTHDKDEIPESVILNFHGDLLDHGFQLRKAFSELNINIIVIFTENLQEYIKLIEKMSIDYSKSKLIVFPLENFSKELKFTRKNTTLVSLYKDVKEANLNAINEALRRAITANINNLTTMTPILGGFEWKWFRNKASLLKKRKMPDDNWQKYAKAFKEHKRSKGNSDRIKNANKMVDQANKIVKLGEENMQLIQEIFEELNKAQKHNPHIGLELAFWNMESVSNEINMKRVMGLAAQSCEMTENNDYRNLATDLAVKMLVNGYSIELLEGENNWIYKKWIEDIFAKLHERNPHAKVVILSVLGMQSSYKSSLLNDMFHLNLKTDVSRCTKGVDMCLLEVDKRAQEHLNYSHILVLDVEGLCSIEKKNEDERTFQENELATTIVCMSDLVLINIKGANTGEMENILEMCIFALARMKSIKADCKLAFVHHNVKGSSEEVFEKTKHLRETLNKTIENIKKSSSMDLGGVSVDLESRETVHYINDKDKSNRISYLKKCTLNLMHGRGKSFQDICEFRIIQVWDAIIEESFAFYFSNSKEYKVQMSIEKEFHAILGSFREAYENAKMRLSENSSSSSNDKEALKREKERLLEQFKMHFESPPHKEIKKKHKLSNLHEMGIEMDQTIEELNGYSKLAEWTEKLKNEMSNIKINLKHWSEEIARKNLNVEQRKEFFDEKTTELKKSYCKSLKYEPNDFVNHSLEATIVQELRARFSHLVEHQDKIKKYETNDVTEWSDEFKFDKNIHEKTSPSNRNLRKIMFKTDPSEVIERIRIKAVSQLNGFIERKHSKICGLRKATIHKLIEQLIETINSNIDQEVIIKLSEYFVRDFAYFLAFQVLLEKLKAIQDYYDEKNNPEIVFDQMVSQLRLLYDSICDSEIYKLICSDFFNWVRTAIEQKLIKRKKKEIRKKLKHITKMQYIYEGLGNILDHHGKVFSKKSSISNYIPVETKTEKEVDLDYERKQVLKEFKIFISCPAESIRSFIKTRIAEEAESLNLKKEISEVTETILKQLSEAVRSTNSETHVNFGRWLVKFYKSLGNAIKLDKKCLSCFNDVDVSAISEFNAEMDIVLDKLFNNCPLISREVEDDMRNQLLNDIISTRIGCTWQCPGCGAICDSEANNHWGAHYSTNHSLTCFRLEIRDRENANLLLKERCWKISSFEIEDGSTDFEKFIEVKNKWNFEWGSEIKLVWLWLAQEYASEIGVKSPEENSEKIPMSVARESLKNAHFSARERTAVEACYDFTKSWEYFMVGKGKSAE